MYENCLRDRSQVKKIQIKSRDFKQQLLGVLQVLATLLLLQLILVFSYKASKVKKVFNSIEPYQHIYIRLDQINATYTSIPYEKIEQVDPPKPDPPVLERLAVVTKVKNENAADMSEWIDYHKCQGVSKFIIADDQSQVPLNTSILEYIESGLVEYSYVRPDEPRLYPENFFNLVIEKNRDKFDWIAIIDIDEFIVKIGEHIHTPLLSILQEYKEYAGLTLQWVTLGSSHFKASPKAGVIRSYTQCITNMECHDSARQFKTIVNTRFKSQVHRNHAIKLAPHGENDNKTSYAVMPDFVRENGEWISERKDRDALKKIVLYHYITKSEEDFQKKIERGHPDGGMGGRQFQFFQEINNCATDFCEDGILNGLSCSSLKVQYNT